MTSALPPQLGIVKASFAIRNAPPKICSEKVKRRPVGLDLTTVTVLRTGSGEQLGLKRDIRISSSGSGQLSPAAWKRSSVARTVDAANLADRYATATNELQPKNFAYLAHGGSLCWHPVPPLDEPKERA